MEALRGEYPSAFLALTFFSPSGYDRQKNFHAADWVGYLPVDTRRQARRFLTELDPTLVLWVKYDFWFNHLEMIYERAVPSLLFAASFREGSWLGKPWARPFRDVILSFGKIAVQDPGSAALIARWGGPQAVVAGDPRVDRVLDLPAEPFEDTVLAQFAGLDPVIVCGSVWEEDVELIAHAIRHPQLAAWKWLIAPHDIKEQRIKGMEAHFGEVSIRYTQPGLDPSTARIMVLDTIGMLNKAYRLGRIAYVGGGFGKSVHNLLEPAVYGVPVIFGPRHGKFPEGAGLIAADAGFVVQTKEILCDRLIALADEETGASKGQKAKGYVLSHAGATKVIMHIVRQLLPS